MLRIKSYCQRESSKGKHTTQNYVKSIYNRSGRSQLTHHNRSQITTINLKNIPGWFIPYSVLQKHCVSNLFYSL